MSTRSRNERVKNSLDMKLSSAVNRDDPGPAVGIELELEFPQSSTPVPVSGVYWNTKAEGSLRNGVEYVSRKPTPLNELDTAINYLYSELPGNVKDSIRCSTHLHVNCLHLTFREIFGAIALYYLTEDLLVDKHPDSRKGNLFCLRMSDAENVGEDILHGVTEALQMGKPRFFSSFNQDRHKYAALNVYMLRALGTMEFRFMKAFRQRTEMQRWCDILIRLVYEGRRYEAGDHLRLYDDLDTHDYLRKMFGREHTEYLTEGKTKTEVNTMMHKNYDFVFDLARSLSTIRHYELPREMWDADSVEGPQGPLADLSGRPYAPVPDDFPGDPWNVESDEVPEVHPRSRGSLCILASEDRFDDFEDAQSSCEEWKLQWPALNYYVASWGETFHVVCHEVLPYGVAMALSQQTGVALFNNMDIDRVGSRGYYDATCAATISEAQARRNLAGLDAVSMDRLYNYDDEKYFFIPSTKVKHLVPSFSAMSGEIRNWELGELLPDGSTQAPPQWAPAAFHAQHLNTTSSSPIGQSINMAWFDEVPTSPTEEGE